MLINHGERKSKEGEKRRWAVIRVKPLLVFDLAKYGTSEKVESSAPADLALISCRTANYHGETVIELIVESEQFEPADISRELPSYAPQLTWISTLS